MTAEQPDILKRIVSKRERCMKWSIDDAPLFIAIVRHKGLTAAADNLGIAKSTLSKALTRLEKGLNLRLIERNSRSLRITPEGDAFYQQCLQIMEQVREADHVMEDLGAEPKGKLRVALPIAFSRDYVARRLPEFCQRFPKVELEIIITSHPVDIIRNHIDLAVVVGAQNDSELIMRPLHEGRLVWVSSPQYVAQHELGSTLDHLRSHIRLCEQRYASARFPVNINGQHAQLDLTDGVVHINDPISVREAVLSGWGVSLLASQYCRPQIERGELVPVFEHIGFEASAARLSAVYPGSRVTSAKIKAFLGFLSGICEEMPG